MFLKKWSAASLAIAAVAALCLTQPAAAESKPYVPKITWKKCKDADLDSYGARCADVAVPLDHAKPHGKKITIAISRVKHTVKASKYQGVMFANPGGPGGSGLWLSTFGDYVPGGAGKAYDWIGFDPRGVGRSKPVVRCDGTYNGYDRPAFVPTTPEIEQAWFARTTAYTDACRSRNGAILDHMTTEDVARDLDLIRAALHRPRINYYGFSYGTYLGQVYSTLFPSRVRRMVFDGTVDPRGIWYQNNLDQDAPFDSNVNAWFAWLAQRDARFHLGDTATEVKDLFYATRDKLDETPVKTKRGLIGGSEWNDTFLWAGYYQGTWTGLADAFSEYVVEGQVRTLAQAYLEASGYGDDNGYAVYLGVQCTDAPWPTSWEKWSQDNWAIHALAPFETWANAWFNEPCRHWPGKARRPVTVTGAKVKSLLLVNETLDAATPYAGSLEVRRRYPQASLVAVKGGRNHSYSLSGNRCVDHPIVSYLRSGALPKRRKGDVADKTCAPLPLPRPGAQSQRAASRSEPMRLQLQRAGVIR